MSLVVTGASGHLGRLTVQALLDRGVEPGSIVAAARTPERLDDLAGRGVDVRRADYTDPQSLKAALAGAERVLLISGSEFGARLEQHRNVVDAARDAGVDLIAYTSIVRADTTRMLLAADHAATERLIVESGLPYLFLRNSWYLENYTEQIATALEHRVVPGSAGAGRVSAATRADYAAAAAAVLVGDGPRHHAYELGGDTAFTLADYVATLSDRPARRSRTPTSRPPTTRRSSARSGCRPRSRTSSPTPTSASPGAISSSSPATCAG